ncbi:MAG: hypothetical protein JW864_09915 [Spirochaetes bacterium]|nr:hypothetical protein [Spirochaetota bacterium]
MKPFRLLPLLLLLLSTLLTCSADNITKVTVMISKNGHAVIDQQKLPLIDRILNIFSSEVYAQTYYEPGDTTQFLLWAFADDWEEETYVVADGNASSISIEVPSGPDRYIFLYSFGTYDVNYIGSTQVDLPGGEVTVQLNMYPCIYDIDTPDYTLGNTYAEFTWSSDPTISETYSNMNVYRSCMTCSDDSFYQIGEFIPITNGFFTDGEISGTDYYYYIFIFQIDAGAADSLPIPANFTAMSDEMLYLFEDGSISYWLM